MCHFLALCSERFYKTIEAFLESILINKNSLCGILDSMSCAVIVLFEKITVINLL